MPDQPHPPEPDAESAATGPGTGPAHEVLPVADRVPIRRALISVSDKTGLLNLGRALAGAGVTIVSTGSTASHLADAGIAVTPVEQLTGFPECLSGRVKTLHPAIHAGILADRRLDDHREQLEELSIEPFDLIVVNLYPFAETVASGASPDECVEQIDIGGPAMVRAAAKNFPSVTLLTDPSQYEVVTAAIDSGGFTLDQRRRLAAEGFVTTAAYDKAVSEWMVSQLHTSDDAENTASAADAPALNSAADFLDLTDENLIAATRLTTLRYGENPHQRARFLPHNCGDETNPTFGLATAEQLGGKAMSYNNYIDADAAIRAVADHDEPGVVVMKHNNPCGLAVAPAGVPDPIAAAHAAAHATDPVSAYGGVIAANRTVTRAMAEQVRPIFTEVIAAPDFDEAALEVLQAKKNLRILRHEPRPRGGVETREVWGGSLIQDTDTAHAPGDVSANWTLVAGEAADEVTLRDLAFAWRAVRAVKSNAILLAANGAATGIGMGQVNRLDSCRLAVERANTLADGSERARGSVAASDAFFPFPDGLQILIDAGVRAVVQPGGSIRDDEIIQAAQAAGVTMYLTGVRHFAH